MPPGFMDRVYNLMDFMPFIEAVRCVRSDMKDPVAQERRRLAAEVKSLNAALLAAWTYPAGTPVIVTRDDGSEVETTTRSRAWALGHGEPVVLLEAFTGGFLLARVRPRAPGVPSEE